MSIIYGTFPLWNAEWWLQGPLAYPLFGAYLWVATALIYLMRGPRDRSPRWLRWGLGAFHIPFGLEQAMEAGALWGVGGNFADAMKAVTAVASHPTPYSVLPPTHSWHGNNALDNAKWITLSGASTGG